MHSTLDISLSQTAAEQIKTILKKEKVRYLRVSVEGGGCSGFSYKYDLTNTLEGDDIQIERDGAIVLVDSMSVEFLKGSVIDYVDELIGASFQIKNPNATVSCGCGTSFSI